MKVLPIVTPADLGLVVRNGWPASGTHDSSRRVRSAAFTVAAFAGIEGTTDEPLEDVLVDLLADLQHLADAAEVDWVRIEDLAAMHHEEERDHADDPEPPGLTSLEGD